MAAEVYLPSQEHPALIKIDVEGSEIEAIKGARRLIEEGALFIRACEIMQFDASGRQIRHHRFHYLRQPRLRRLLLQLGRQSREGPARRGP